MVSGSCGALAELPEPALEIVRSARRAVLATIDAEGRPHVVPVCFALRSSELVTAVDQKPKGGGNELARVRNVRRRGVATMTMDRWDEDWTRLGWVMLRGPARIDVAGSADDELLERYPQYRDESPRGEVIALRPERILWWMWEQP